MHGTGFMTALVALLSGGTIVTVDNANFDPHAIWAAVEKNRVAEHRDRGRSRLRSRLLRALDEAPGRYDLSSLMAITSSGAMWSVEVKRGLIKHMPAADADRQFRLHRSDGHGQFDHDEGRRDADRRVHAAWKMPS